MHPLETYLRHVSLIRSSGAAVPETSFYGALENLFNEVGSSLKPKVHCIIHPRNVGAGIPDGGLFSADQIRDDSISDPVATLTPARGAIEVKPAKEDTAYTASTDQVALQYLPRYGQVLVTNLRDFVLVGQDDRGRPLVLESFRLAEDEVEFWKAAAHPTAVVDRHGDRFLEYLKRVMLHAAPLAAPQDVAWFLASYARDALGRIEHVELDALTSIRGEFEDALGLTFEDERGDHFFRSTLVQTLFYGIFSAWVLWDKEYPPGSNARFDWRVASWLLRVPMIRSLFHQVADPARLEPLGLVEVLDWTATVLNRVSRKVFFERFEEEHAVQYFYEPFLHAFDPELRRQLGVWYTPPEIVKYMVARVDTVLREELDVPDGLADPNVYVLDPATGTGSYLVEVLRSIDATLRQRGVDALSAHRVKQAAMNRVFGFEILPAPFVIAHLQLGLFLQNLGAPLAANERAGVYLTNALTGWEPSSGPKQRLPTLELEQERDAAEHVKRDTPILVVIGNPPYNAFAGVSPDEEQGLVEPYKEGLISKWGIKKFNLDDLYVRFFRLAERRIAEKTGKGVVCYISNFSYLDAASFVVMRERFAKEFDKLWFDRMNGDSRETGKTTPDGKPDPSVFSTQHNRQGIRVGTAIGLMVRKDIREPTPLIRFRHFWGMTKRDDLVRSLDSTNFDAQYAEVSVDERSRFAFIPTVTSDEYLNWPRVIDLAGVPPFNGPVERRGLALISIDRHELETRIRQYFDSQVTDSEIEEIYPSLMMTGNRIVGPDARKKLLRETSFDPTKVVRYLFKPFDLRWCYLDNIRPLFSEPSPQLINQNQIPGNAYFVTRDAADHRQEGRPSLFTTVVSDYHSIGGEARHLPVFTRPNPAVHNQQSSLPLELEDPTPNLSSRALGYLHAINQSKDPETQSIWFHALAITHAPSYLSENEDGVREDWPRIPMPRSAGIFLASARSGEQIAGLLDVEQPVHGVTHGTLRTDISSIGRIRASTGGQLNPGTGDLSVNARWGYMDSRGAVMPGAGTAIEREYTNEERTAIGEDAIVLLGPTTYDIYLNDRAYWANVPARVWDYTIGGYQVMKKWLSYREHSVLGRPLTPDEVQEVTHMARRIAALVLLEPELNRNYEAVKASTYAWPDAGTLA